MDVAFKQKKDMRWSLHDSPGIGGLARNARRQAVRFRIVLRLSRCHDLLAGLGERNWFHADGRRLASAPAAALLYRSRRVAPNLRHARFEVANRAAAIPDSRQVHFAVGEMRRRSHRSAAATPSATLRGIRIRAASGGSCRLRGSQRSGRLRQERDHAECRERPERESEESFHIKSQCRILVYTMPVAPSSRLGVDDLVVCRFLSSSCPRPRDRPKWSRPASGVTASSSCLSPVGPRRFSSTWRPRA
jgi:hypothetical protein